MSVDSFRKCCLRRYVQDKTKRCIKPVLGIAAGVYLLGLILFIPIQMIAFLLHIVSFGNIDTSSVKVLCSNWLFEATALVPLLCVLVLRAVIRKPLFKCFIHTLREVNPAAAHAIDSQPRIQNPRKKTWRQWVTSYVNKTAQLLVLEFAIYLWKQTPGIGLAAEPVMHFVTMSHALEPRRAVVLSGLALVPRVAPIVHSFVHLWRASSVLGEELLEDYVSHIVEHANRDSFFRRRGVTITTFVMPQLLIMKVPILGPLAMLPMAASAAYLVDLLVGKGEATNRAASAGLANRPHLSLLGDMQAAQQGPAPTLPMGKPIPAGAEGMHIRGAGKGDLAQQGSFENASAPPWEGIYS